MKDISQLNHLLSQANVLKSKLQPSFDHAEKSAKKFEAAFQSALQSKSVTQDISALKQTVQTEKNNLLQGSVVFNSTAQNLSAATTQAIAPIITAANVIASTPAPPQQIGPAIPVVPAISAIDGHAIAVTSPNSTTTTPPSAPVVTQNGVQQVVTLRDTFDMQKALVTQGMNADQAQSAVSQTLGINVIKPDFSNYQPDYTLVKSAGYINTPSGWVVDPNYNPSA